MNKKLRDKLARQMGKAYYAAFPWPPTMDSTDDEKRRWQVIADLAIQRLGSTPAAPQEERDWNAP